MNPLNAARAWIVFHEVPDGHWATAGRLYRLDDVLRFVTGNPPHSASQIEAP
jgi:hypothetical protein